MDLHGEITVRTKAGGTEVVVLQNGTVTSTGTSGSTATVTVTSTDGFTSTYTVTAATRIIKNGSRATFADLKHGDTVRLTGTSANGALTATSIRDGAPRALNTHPRNPSSPSTPASPTTSLGGAATT